MSDDFSRRDLLRNLGLVTIGGAAALDAAQHVHQAAAAEKKTGAPYQPKYFNEHEYRTLTRLTDLVIPPDDRSQGAVAAGAPQFIDYLASRNREIAGIYTGGIGWIDAEMRRRHESNFLDCTPEQQTALLDVIAYKTNETPETAPGIRFFGWLRDMTLDAFYTSKIGMDDLGFMGNSAMSEFKVPQEAIDYALKRSGL